LGSQRKKKERGTESIFEQTRAENCNLGKEKGIQVHEAQRNPLKINKNWSIPRHIIVKLAKYKDKDN